MKIRLGFVSNSSSSSFIIAFTKEMITKDIKEQAISEFCLCEDQDINEENINNIFEKALNILCTDEIIYGEESSPTKEEELAYIIGINLPEKHMIIEIEGGPDRASSCVNILSTKNQQKVKELYYEN